jgi:D-alanine-D-alanine ligase
VHRTFDFEGVVVVADLIGSVQREEQVHLRGDLEMTDRATLDELLDCITDLGLKVHHYLSPDELAANADHHGRDVVLTIYGGRGSRNRMALVPAVCESFGLRFIGPDVYGRIVAQDKEISKRLALDCGIQTPPWRLIRSKADITQSFGLSGPVVVKPLMEGSSIGISQRNLVESIDDVAVIALELLERFRQPVLIEQFVAGREVAYTKIQHHSEDIWAFSEIVMSNNENYFVNRLFDAEEKYFRSPHREVRNIDKELRSGEKTRLDAFLSAFGQYGYCRVDGRFADGHFHFLEFTPDAWIAPRGQFAQSFIKKGCSFSQIVATILASATPIPPGR